MSWELWLLGNPMQLASAFGLSFPFGRASCNMLMAN